MQELETTNRKVACVCYSDATPAITRNPDRNLHIMEQVKKKSVVSCQQKWQFVDDFSSDMWKEYIILVLFYLLFLSLC